MALHNDTRNTTADLLRSTERRNGELDFDSSSMSWDRVSDDESVAFEQAVGDFAVPTNVMTSTEKRLEYVLNCARQAGFDSFDDLVMAYYTSEFDYASHLFFEQRQSRNRRLPNVLAEVRQSSKTWTQWERQGYCDEVLKAAESILLKEFRTFVRSSSLEECVRSLNNMPVPIETSVDDAPQHLQESEQSQQSQWFDALLGLQRRFYSEVS
jgi:hypothetical protein